MLFDLEIIGVFALLCHSPTCSKVYLKAKYLDALLMRVMPVQSVSII